MTTATKSLNHCDFATCVVYKVAAQGTVGIYRNTDKTFTVEHSDLYEVFSQEIFKTYKAAKREYKCY
jgi:hypothetical protein